MCVCARARMHTDSSRLSSQVHTYTAADIRAAIPPSERVPTPPRPGAPHKRVIDKFATWLAT